MRITLIASDVSGNALGRTALLAEILRREFDVEVLGTAFGEGIWAPLQKSLRLKTVVRGQRWPVYLSAMRSLQRQITGDVVYAVKPLMSSFGVALLHRRRTGCPLVLDIDDDERAFRRRASLREPLSLLRTISAPNQRFWTERIGQRVPTADALTVASTPLQQHFGGTLVRHARNTEQLRPRPEWQAAAKERLGVAGQGVVMFFGTPRPHKGLEDAAVAVAQMRHEAVLVVVGADEADSYTSTLKRQYPQVRFHPPCAFDEALFLLQAADVMIALQRDLPASRYQSPAKLMDAMAVAKPVVATALSDIPEILGDRRGYVVPPGDVPAATRCLDDVFDHPEEARQMGQRARIWCVQHASHDSVQRSLNRLMRSLAARPQL
jgi:glycosyltransferase involved in cell wall biosynthesis